MDTTSVAVQATGKGVAMIQLIVNYNVETVDRSQNLQLDVTTRKVEESLVLELTFRLINIFTYFVLVIFIMS